MIQAAEKFTEQRFVGCAETEDVEGYALSTFKGHLLNPARLKPEEVDIEDIAHSLATTCRFNGMCQGFYSNAQHSVNVADRSLAIFDATMKYEDENLKQRDRSVLAMAALMHDGHEPYSQDTIRPRKQFLAKRFPEAAKLLHEVDCACQRAVNRAFSCQHGEGFAQIIKQADNEVTRLESLKIMADMGEDWNWGDIQPAPMKWRAPMDWEDAESLFIKRFVKYARAIRANKASEPVESTEPEGQTSSYTISLKVENGMGEKEYVVSKVTQHESGAVRSSDADDVRFDLISPVAIAAVEKCAAQLCEMGRLLPRWQTNIAELIQESLDDVYAAIGGDWGGSRLELAAVKLLIAIAKLEGQSDPQSIELSKGYGYCLLPYHGMKRLAKTYQEGAVKYSAHNWMKGFDVPSLLNHAIRHYFLWFSGDRSEDHLPHALWGLFAAIHSLKCWPHLNAGKLLGPGCTPPAA